jgi:hypothetical protein
MGWLKKNGHTWTIEDLGVSNKGSNRIKYEDMNLNNINEIKNARFAEDKYRLTRFANPETENGFIVFTGKVGREKTREFIFPKSDQNNTKYELNDNDIVVKSFKEAYYIGTINENKLWKDIFSKRLRNREKIPVFFLLKDKKVDSFGLSMLYKLPYKYSTYDGIGEHSVNFEKIDLAEAILGYSKKIGDKNLSLKGRVHFSHLKITDDIEGNLNPVKKLLSNPRAGYYPMYSQNGNSMNSNYQISGWKRYPIHNDANTSNDAGNEKMLTTFKPLPSGTQFLGKIHFHNLKKIEIGALLFSLGLSSGCDDCFYSLGMAKPFGFGKIKIDLCIKDNKKINVKDCIDEFLKTMQNWLKDNELSDNLMETEQFRELISMMIPKDSDEHLRYGPPDQKGFEYYGDIKQNKIDDKREQYSQNSNINNFFSVNNLKTNCETISKIKENIKEKAKLMKIEVPTNKQLNKAIEIFIKQEARNLPYFDINFLNNYLTERYDNIPEDLINSFETLYDSNSFRKIGELLTKKAHDSITDIDKRILLRKLEESIKKD